MWLDRTEWDRFFLGSTGIRQHGDLDKSKLWVPMCLFFFIPVYKLISHLQMQKFLYIYILMQKGNYHLS